MERDRAPITRAACDAKRFRETRSKRCVSGELSIQLQREGGREGCGTARSHPGRSRRGGCCRPGNGDQEFRHRNREAKIRKGRQRSLRFFVVIVHRSSSVIVRRRSSLVVPRRSSCLGTSPFGYWRGFGDECFVVARLGRWGRGSIG